MKLPISEEIRQRIQTAGARYHSNDNISEFIKDNELQLLQDEVANNLEE